MSPKLGQKIKDNPKNILLQVRVNQETIDKLDEIAEKYGLNRSKVVRECIDTRYEEMKRE